MLRKLGRYSDDMWIAITLWMCSLPLAGLLVVPFFGWKAGLVAAAALLIGAMIVCWGICGWKVFSVDDSAHR
jgi:hypothetical protein